MRVVAGAAAGRPLTGSHLLLLDEAVPADAVRDLVRARSPQAVETGGALRLGRYTTLAGPLLLDADAATAAGVPDPWRAAWALDCPVEREGPPLPGTSDRQGLHRAFADGLPVRAERRGVDLLLALARRLDGAVRVRPSGVVLVPDPRAWVDRTVHAPVWLDRDHALTVVARAAPQVRAAPEPEPWRGLLPAAVAKLEAPGAGAGLTDAERERLHLAADRRDALAAAAAGATEGAVPAAEGYALTIELDDADSTGDGTVGESVVEVGVGRPEEVPPAVAEQPWATRSAAYEVRWWPADEVEAEREQPGRAHRTARRRAARVVAEVAGALAAATGGVVVDADGFPLQP